MNLLTKFFLSLLIILLGGYSQLSAEVCEQRYSNSSIQSAAEAGQSDTVALAEACTITDSYVPFAKEKHRDKIENPDSDDDADDDDTELGSSKKTLDHSGYFTSSFAVHIADGYFRESIKKQPSYCRNFSCTSYCRMFIKNRVIRI